MNIAAAGNFWISKGKQFQKLLTVTDQRLTQSYIHKIQSFGRIRI